MMFEDGSSLDGYGDFLTESAVEWIVDGSCLPGKEKLGVVLILPPLEGALLQHRFQMCQISDGKHRIEAFIDTTETAGNDNGSRRSCYRHHHSTIFSHPSQNSSYYIIQINGYISSDTNGHKNCDPFVCITSYQIIKDLHQDIRPLSIQKPAHLDKILAGQFSSFFLRHISFFQSHDILSLNLESASYQTMNLGSNDESCENNNDGNHNNHTNDDTTENILSFGGEKIKLQDLETFSDFLLHQKAMKMTLASISSNIVASFQNEKYIKAIKCFSLSQITRQTASLTSNTGKENVTRAKLTSDSHSLALEAALKHAEDPKQPALSPETICSWHLLLGGNGEIIPNAGVYRRKKVKAGTTRFIHHSQIDSEIQKVCAGLKVLESNLLGYNLSPYNCDLEIRNRRGYGPLIFAAVAMFAIIDIHPFTDGNGRLSRIVANWALRRSGLPFVINMFATKVQRIEYIRSIAYTLQNSRLVTKGPVSDETLSSVRQKIGILKPLAYLILDRITKSLVEFEKVYNDIITKENEQQATLASKTFREKASTENCLICFDSKPNIVTLCCGKAVHLNCLAEWLSSKSTCPQCRGEMPSLPRKFTDTKDENENNNFTPQLRYIETIMRGPEIDDLVRHDDDEFDSSDSSNEYSMEHDHNTTTSSYSEASEDEEQVSAPVRAPLHPFPFNINSLATVAARNAFRARATALEAMNDETEVSDDTMGSTETYEEEEEEENGATITPDDQQTQILYCRSETCSNRAAIDCTNQKCGRCCVLFGGWPCARHGSDNN